ncbi:MAG: hypothetical protein KDA41_10785, partial [Planctomycetales bacterium]|nr:hypothetical protein [Planctomycetales bacterium]
MADSSTQADDAAPLPKDSAAVTPRSILEAMLFVGNAANEPLERQRAADCMRGVALDEVDVLVDELNAEYEELG